MLAERVRPHQLRSLVADDRRIQAALVLAVTSLALGMVAGRLTPTDAVDGSGIVFALPALYWLAVALGVAATGFIVGAALDGHRWLGPVAPGLWLGLVHAAPALAHGHARFPIVYTHMGFIRLIEARRTGDILIDARFAWPGFFGLFVAPLANLDPRLLDVFLRLWPTMITGVTAVLVAALARRSYPNRPMIGPVSSTVFVLLQWTGQDYFSPQSMGFLFYLAIVIVLESGPLRPRGAWSSVAPILSRFATAGGDRPASRSNASFVAVLLLAFGAVVSHPLAPFFICAGLGMLAVYGRIVAWRLLLMVGVAYALWIVVAAEPWWSTRLDELFGQFGQFGGNVESSTSGRTVTSAPAHLFVTRIRTVIGLLTFVATLVLGLVMATDRYRHLRPALPLAPLAGIPVVAAGLQSYGGEIIIRVLLFTLPMASILFARMLLALPARRSRSSSPCWPEPSSRRS